MTREERLRAQAEKAIRAQTDALEKRDTGKFRYLADDHECPLYMRLAALTEELGEVGRALHDGDEINLAIELNQLAGIALAWGSIL